MRVLSSIFSSQAPVANRGQPPSESMIRITSMYFDAGISFRYSNLTISGLPRVWQQSERLILTLIFPHGRTACDFTRI
jgi:hypothetical protein